MPDDVTADIPPGWTLTEDGVAIERAYHFADFVQAIGFMAGVAPHCERANHHPEWQNTYRHVEVRLTTHEAGGLTDRDIALAKIMDQVAGLLLEG